MKRTQIDFCRECFKKIGLPNINKITNAKQLLSVQKLQLPVGRSHCKSCGGVFCSDCVAQHVTLEGKSLDRCCKGCLRGETPGDKIRSDVEHRLQNVDVRQSRRVTSRNVGLSYAPLEETTVTKRPKKGYFEFINKTSSFISVKLICGVDGTDLATYWEIPRPSYRAMPANGVVRGEFDYTTPLIEVIVLTGNSHGPVDGEPIVYDTTSGTAVSACAKVAHFKRFTAYRILSTDKNVVLKFKTTEMGYKLEPRRGTGLFSSRKDNALRTNVDSSQLILLSSSATMV